jgi:hypothetical protein
MSKHNTGRIFRSSISLETTTVASQTTSESGRITILISTISLFLLSLVRRWMRGMCVCVEPINRIQFCREISI